MLHNADLAMYFSKRRANGGQAFFDASMSDGALRRMTVEGKLRGALERNELSLHYQPQFELATGELSGLEALLRWTNPDLGPVPVLEFIEIAEDTGSDRADRRLGAAQRLRSGASYGASRVCRSAIFRSTSRAFSSCAAISRRPSPKPSRKRASNRN